MPLCRQFTQAITDLQDAPPQQTTTEPNINISQSILNSSGIYKYNSAINETVLHNLTFFGTDKPPPVMELNLVKAVVLVVVIVVLLLSTCKLVFKTFSRYTKPKGEGGFE